MKYCAECWKKKDVGGGVCPDCGAKLFETDNWDSFTIVGGLLTKCYDAKIPYGVTAIAKDCLGYGSAMTEIILPNSVKFIADRAFSSASQLKRVVVPSSVTHIGYEAFYNCHALTDSTMPGIKCIGKSAFTGCYELSSVMIGKNIVSIGEYAFANCYKLTSVKFGGTKAQWRAIKKGQSWKNGVPTKVVHCTDGDLPL